MNSKQKKRKGKSKFLQITEYIFVKVLIVVVKLLPHRALNLISKTLGWLLFNLVPRRRKIALLNIKSAYKDTIDMKEVERIARKSCDSFFMSYLEMIKYQDLLTDSEKFSYLKKETENVDQLFRRAKEYHDRWSGCIFVTPHIGNWEILPYVSHLAGIPLVVVVRPLDNLYLERLLFSKRSQSGQLIIPKRNALFQLQKTLQRGNSIGMLPDQSTMKGIPVDFFGKKATTTPVPAILSIRFKRPIVVVACLRKPDGLGFDGYLSEPILPSQDYTSERSEIYRLTWEMNREMENVIRSRPEQYLWIHNRWKTYKGKVAVMDL